MIAHYLVPRAGNGTYANVFRPKYLQSDFSGNGKAPLIAVTSWSLVDDSGARLEVSVDADEATHVTLANLPNVDRV